MGINLELYKVFYHVGRSGSISRAATELFISQPAVSQSIRQLEDALGGALFIRASRGLSFTPEGERLFREIERGYEIMRNAETNFHGAVNLDKGEIRIGASDMTLKYYLLDHLEVFHRLYPGITVKVTNGPSPETVRALRAGDIDLGVVSLPLPDSKGIRVTAVSCIHDVFVAGNKYSELKGVKTPLSDLCAHPLVMLERNTSSRRYVDLFMQRHGVSLTPAFELATSDLLVEFAKRNLGISCVVRNFAQDAVNEGTLFELELEIPIPPREFGIATLEHSPIPAAAKRLLKLMETDAPR